MSRYAENHSATAQRGKFAAPVLVGPPILQRTAPIPGDSAHHDVPAGLAASAPATAGGLTPDCDGRARSAGRVVHGLVPSLVSWRILRI